jgi:ribonuclease HII
MKPMKFIAGIDEAGRGPVIGPMVIAGVLVDEERIHELSRAGVKDSKKLAPKKREALLKPIMEIAVKYHVEVIAASAIDVTRPTKNLNWIEAGSMARIIDALKPDLAQIGSVDVLPSRFKRMVIEEMGYDQAIDCIHHAEDMYPAVAAASIIAKTTRDRLVASLREEYGDFGSGYPSDQKSRNFISEYIAGGKQLPPIVRRSWKTVENLSSDLFF